MVRPTGASFGLYLRKHRPSRELALSWHTPAARLYVFNQGYRLSLEAGSSVTAVPPSLRTSFFFCVSCCRFVFASRSYACRCCGADEFIKLHAYTLTDYHRVVHLDVDTFILHPMDELFGKPHCCCCCVHHLYRFSTWWSRRQALCDSSRQTLPFGIFKTPGLPTQWFPSKRTSILAQARCGIVYRSPCTTKPGRVECEPGVHHRPGYGDEVLEGRPSAGGLYSRPPRLESLRGASGDYSRGEVTWRGPPTQTSWRSRYPL